MQYLSARLRNAYDAGNWCVHNMRSLRKYLGSWERNSFLVLTGLVLVSFPFAFGILDRYVEEAKGLKTIDVRIEEVWLENTTNSFRIKMTFLISNPSRLQMKPFATSYYIYLNGERIGSNGSSLYAGIPPNGSLTIRIVHSVIKRMETQWKVSVIETAAKDNYWSWFVSGTLSFNTIIPPGTAVISFSSAFSGVQFSHS